MSNHLHRLPRPQALRSGISVCRKGLSTSVRAESVHKSAEKLASARHSDRERVVILGSGWAGYTVARSLDPKKYQAIVVSPRSYFVFTPLLASTAVGTLEFRAALEPVRSKHTRVSFLQGWADGVNFQKKTITVEEAVEDPLQARALVGDRHEGQSPEQRAEQKKLKKTKGNVFDISYDKLVIAVGCYMQTFGVPGVRENALFLKDIGDARRIRNRLLSCFETAALPTTSDEMKKALLNFVVVGGGPTGIEFSAELHDIITEDLVKMYPELADHFKITVYDVAPTVLSMFDKKLRESAVDLFNREGIAVKTSHHVEEIRRGLPAHLRSRSDPAGDSSCLTLKVKEEGEIAAGMVVWSTGLATNPFVQKALENPLDTVSDVAADGNTSGQFRIQKHPKTGGIVTDGHLRVLLEGGSKTHGGTPVVMKDVFALGDAAAMSGAMYPATAQVASQQANWLAKRLNKGDLEQHEFSWRNMGTMAYLGNWNAILETSRGDISGRAAWVVWRGAYLTKAVSWRNKILIPVYWVINWVFGRDISRF